MNEEFYNLQGICQEDVGLIPWNSETFRFSFFTLRIEENLPQMAAAHGSGGWAAMFPS